MKLDRKESYGTVYGHTEIAYEQAGHQFRPDGSLYEPGEKKPPPLSLKPAQSEQWAKTPHA